ncbi:MAG: HesA/MoeB/ThiF family protein [Pyrinomonadaceae bacterium]
MLEEQQGETTVARIKDPTRDRYHALALSSVWELEKIRNAQALVIGAGALGNEVSKNLVMLGVRRIIILDRDTVEVANLSRSIFFRESDHGRPKSEILKERLREFNPDVDVIAVNGDLNEALGIGLVRRMDMIFSCLDNRLARRTINRMCQKVSKPWVDGSMENLLGDVTVYLPNEGPCYECGLTLADKEVIAKAVSCRGIALQNLSLGKVPTVSTMGSIIAALQVQEAIKLLHDAPSGSLGGKRLVVNCEINDFYRTVGDRKDDCPGHFRYGDITEVAEWQSDTVSPQEILGRFEVDSGNTGHIRLGREIVIALYCAVCNTEEALGEPLNVLKMERTLCPTCGEMREVKTTNVVRGTEPYANKPLAQLGLPLLDIIEVRGRSGSAWYEITGDTEAFPSGLH